MLFDLVSCIIFPESFVICTVWRSCFIFLETFVISTVWRSFPNILFYIWTFWNSESSLFHTSTGAKVSGARTKTRKHLVFEDSKYFVFWIIEHFKYIILYFIIFIWTFQISCFTFYLLAFKYLNIACVIHFKNPFYLNI